AAKAAAVIKCHRLGKDTTMLRWDCLWGYANALPYHVIFQQLGGPVWLHRHPHLYQLHLHRDDFANPARQAEGATPNTRW
ncbi:MAG: hypothetical protein ACXVH3_38425, partial [Solirubrobacteraceae bacterium]